MSNRFSFVGTIRVPKEDAKRPFCNSFKKNGKNMKSLNFSICESKNNSAFVEAFGAERDEIKTKNVDGEEIVIDWEDRFDEDVVKEIPNYKKFTVKLGFEEEDYKQFITEYDFVSYLAENLPNYSGKVRAMGTFSKSYYKGKYYDKFKINAVYAVEEDVKNGLYLNMDLYYNKKSLDDSDFKTDKKMILNAYVNQYVDKDTGTKFFPQQMIFCTEKYDMENPKHKKLFDYRMKYLKTNSKNICHLSWDVRLVSGSEEVEFNESMLTDAQKEQVELGVRSIEDFKKKGVYGDYINEYRLVEPKLEGDYADGLVDYEMSESEFAEEIFSPVSDESEDEMLNSATKKAKNKKEEIETDEEELF